MVGGPSHFFAGRPKSRGWTSVTSGPWARTKDCPLAPLSNAARLLRCFDRAGVPVAKFLSVGTHRTATSDRRGIGAASDGGRLDRFLRAPRQAARPQRRLPTRAEKDPASKR